MAYLLGSKRCIESLQDDVKDLHLAVVDVFSRVGPVRFQSWKYPDKQSCDIDIGEILETHKYSEDEEESQVAHIVLLELVIDRMVLLFQSMGKFMEQMLTVGRTPSATPTGSNMSVGLIVKKYWNKMIQLNSLVSQLNIQSKNDKQKLIDLENCNKLQNTPEIYAVRPPPGGVDLRRSSPVLPSISRDCNHKSSQTVETSFVPCDACLRIQHHLKQVGDVTIQQCRTHNIPSSLGKYQIQIETVEWLSATDVGRWTSEHNKDITRINKHFEQIINTVEPLRSDLSKATDKISKLEGELKSSGGRVREEKEAQTIQRKQYESKISNLEKKSQESVNEVRRRNEQSQASKKILEKQVIELKGELDKQITSLRELECAQLELAKEAANKGLIEQLQSEKSTLTEEMSAIRETLHQNQKDLNKEQARNTAIHKHTESLQTKQENLLQRMNDLDLENSEMREQTAELEDKYEQLQDTMDTMTSDKLQLQQQVDEDQVVIKELSAGKKALEDSIVVLQEDIKLMEAQIVTLQERERLLLEYPDLNGPVNIAQGTGDVAQDMENQVKANSLRINILETENQTLRNSITKMLSTQSQHRKHEVNPLHAAPVPLWKKKNTQQTQQHTDKPDAEEGRAVKAIWSSSYRLQKPPPDDETVNPQHRDTKRPMSELSSHQPLQTSNSSIAAYMQLKMSRKIKSPSSGSLKKSLSGGMAPPGSMAPPGGMKHDVYMCSKCDKMFTERRDLDIHKSYCVA